MTHYSKLRNREIRSIAKKYLNERAIEDRTEEPLPADYEAFRREMAFDVGSHEIECFEEEWADIYSHLG